MTLMRVHFQPDVDGGSTPLQLGAVRTPVHRGQDQEHQRGGAAQEDVRDRKCGVRRKDKELLLLKKTPT